MLKNYLLTALRNLRRQGFYTTLNVAGLALGLAACFLIARWVVDELGYDRHHPHAERTYRVWGDVRFSEQELQVTTSPPPMAAALRAELPEVEQVVRFRDYGTQRVRVGERAFKSSFLFADSTLFDVFGLHLLAGDARTALREPHTAVVTEATARQYFGAEVTPAEALNRTFRRGEEETPLRVTGVVAALPPQTHFGADVYVSLRGNEEAELDTWLGQINFLTYVVLRPGTDLAQTEQNLQTMVDRHVAPDVEALTGSNLAAFQAAGNRVAFHLQPLLDIHLHSDLRGELQRNGDVRYVWLFGVVALFLLGIACVNFVNLATARAARRAREVGVRKALGSRRGQLVQQFMVEAG
ncbi:MAG: ABC transporter permease, partial [Catalinimonas sp.]